MWPRMNVSVHKKTILLLWTNAFSAIVGRASAAAFDAEGDAGATTIVVFINTVHASVESIDL